MAQDTPTAGPEIVERSTPGIEIELVGGHRVRFERDTDPEMARRPRSSPVEWRRCQIKMSLLHLIQQFAQS